MSVNKISVCYSIVRLFVPNHDNHCGNFDAETLELARENINILANGMTEIPMAIGYYQSNEQPYRYVDRITIYDVVVNVDGVRATQMLMPIMMSLKTLLRQEVMFGYVIPNIIVVEI